MARGAQQLLDLLLEHGAMDYRPAKTDRRYLRLGDKTFDVATNGKMNPSLVGDLTRKAKGVIKRIKEQSARTKPSHEFEKIFEVPTPIVAPSPESSLWVPPPLEELETPEEMFVMDQHPSPSVVIGVARPKKRSRISTSRRVHAAYEIMQQHPLKTWSLAELADCLPDHLSDDRYIVVRSLRAGFARDPSAFSVFKEFGDWKVTLVNVPLPRVPEKETRSVSPEVSEQIPMAVIQAVEDAIQTNDTSKAWVALGKIHFWIEQRGKK